ncbi:MAG TPA: ShlB/FhaC/HecB family hemolysin secretion/activation protein [Gammaproteobacteria bacterium]|nr:ShlB/FhaC/HecB family hemolysin secretion/activation protein [Gammaproteobacteria bacterium]
MVRRRTVVRKDAKSLALTLLAVSLFPLGAWAQSTPTSTPTLPAAATPGGARPFLGREPRPLMAQEYNLAIPPLVERPPGLDEGPKVRVIEFNVLGATDRPERGISTEDIKSLLTFKLAKQPLEGFTINQLQAIADDITLYYRNHGMLLAQAVVPAQNVKEGTIALQVIEGSLGSIKVEGNRFYDAENIQGPFAGLLNQPVDQDEIEQAILNLQGLPGLTVFGTFRQGQTLGDTELLVSVREEDRFYIRPSIDNYGSQFTGDNRLMLEFGVNNITGHADRFSGYVLETANPSNGTYYGLEYAATTKSTKTSVGIRSEKNRFDVTQASSSAAPLVQGDVQQNDVWVQRRFANRRRYRADGTFDLAVKDSVTRTLTGQIQEQRDELTTLGYTFNYYSVSPRQRGINLGFLRALGGTNDSNAPSRFHGSTRKPAEDNYTKFELGYQRLQRFKDHNALLLRINAQQSDDLLVSLEQFSIGGPANIRAYPIAEGLVDTGAAATLEWIMDAPGFADRPVGTRTWGDVFQLSFFYDYAGGERNDPFPGEQSKINLHGAGIGMLFSVSQKFYLRMDVAKPSSSDPAPSNGKDPQYYVSFNYTF